MSTTYIDLDDIQGNIVKGYGRFGYPVARYLFFGFSNPDIGRRFVRDIYPLITSGRPWQQDDKVPMATTNIAFTYRGLMHLGLAVESLHTFPAEFSMGMKARSEILGDDGSSHARHWDPIWRNDKAVHMFLSINGRSDDALLARYDEIQTILSLHATGVDQLFGHRGSDGANMGYQEARALFEDGVPTAKEHFGFVDGISDPFFKGSGANPNNVIGGGKPTRRSPATDAGWEPLQTGEFILGYPDEAKELPAAPAPRLLSTNGTFMVYRKLHQNVASFNRYLDDVGSRFPGGPSRLAAKMTGRWKNGAPLATFPDEAGANAFALELEAARQRVEQAPNDEARRKAVQQHVGLKTRLSGFNFNDDIAGSTCPLGSHIRRANPRGSLEYGVKGAFATPGALVNRRRILRRGLPYGEARNPDSDDGEHGVIFMAINSSIKRQFEFIQQQWMNYGNDFKLSNDRDPIIGNQDDQGSMMIQGSGPEDPPFLCSKLPRFVSTRGGEYFFIPSLTAIRMIADGLVDPT